MKMVEFDTKRLARRLKKEWNSGGRGTRYKMMQFTGVSAGSAGRLLEGTVTDINTILSVLAYYQWPLSLFVSKHNELRHFNSTGEIREEIDWKLFGECVRSCFGTEPRVLSMRAGVSMALARNVLKFDACEYQPFVQICGAMGIAAESFKKGWQEGHKQAIRSVRERVERDFNASSEA